MSSEGHLHLSIMLTTSLKRVPLDVMIAFNRLSKALNYFNLNININYNINNELNLIELNQIYEPPTKKEWIPPTKEQFKKYILDNKLNINGDDLYKYYSVGDWHDSKGNKVKNWKQKLLVLNSYNKDKQPDTKSTTPTMKGGVLINN